jgi:hypothetical protein
MERRRPNRELKNTEDVQEALIEGYFRYNDLSRMEADAILMNIFEIESANYECVELDLHYSTWVSFIFFISYPINIRQIYDECLLF